MDRRVCYFNSIDSVLLSGFLGWRMPDVFAQSPTQEMLENHARKSWHVRLCLTFISAEFDVSKQPNLNDLPQKSQDQIRLPLLQVLGSYINHMAPNGWGRVQSQVQVFLKKKKNMWAWFLNFDNAQRLLIINSQCCPSRMFSDLEARSSLVLTLRKSSGIIMRKDLIAHTLSLYRGLLNQTSTQCGGPILAGD